MIVSTPLAPFAAALGEGRIELRAFVEELCDRIEDVEPALQALVPEQDRRGRLRAEVAALGARYPDPGTRPPLYGVPVGVKDIFRVDGFPTRAGSALPPELFAGPEAACVAALRGAGALIAGKTVTAEFAFIEPGPTRNPHNLEHTPGGSSSGSAAAVAAGMCLLALGTQTVGSVIRPAAFCGIVGFKPTYGRIPTAGLIFAAPSLDTIGLFTQDVAGMELAAAVVCDGWRPVEMTDMPVVGVPDGPYLRQASAEALAAFEVELARLAGAGIEIRRVPALRDIDEITSRHHRLVSAEMARTHAAWFAEHAPLYRPRTAETLLEGQRVPEAEQEQARLGRATLRDELHRLMECEGVDVLVSPAAPGPAPHGIGSTGNSAMNLPWTHAGLPSVTFPAGRAANGLPLGMQCVAAAGADERLLAWARQLQRSDLSH